MKLNSKAVLIIAAVVIFCIFAIIDLRILLDGKVKSSVKVEGLNEEVKTVKKMIPDNVMEYIMNQRDIAQGDGRTKIVMYYTGYDCPFAKALTKAMETAAKDQKLASKFVFHPEAAAGSKFFLSEDAALTYMEFNDMCQQFCIVSPSKKMLIRVNDMDAQKAEKAAEILEHYKNW